MVNTFEEAGTGGNVEGAEQKGTDVKKIGEVISLKLFKNLQNPERYRTPPLKNGTLGEWGEDILKIKNKKISKLQKEIWKKNIETYRLKQEIKIMSCGTNEEIENILKNRQISIEEKIGRGKELSKYEEKILEFIKLYGFV